MKKLNKAQIYQNLYSCDVEDIDKQLSIFIKQKRKLSKRK